jgi:hypothetical protein
MTDSGKHSSLLPYDINLDREMYHIRGHYKDILEQIYSVFL